MSIAARGHGFAVGLIVSALSLGLLFFPAKGNGEVEAQERAVALAGSATCQRCELHIDRIAVISDEDGNAGMSHGPESMVRTREGHFIVIPADRNMRMEPLHFGPAGEFLGKLGSPGEGPGEYSLPMSVVKGPDETIWVFDLRLFRRTAWSPRGDYLDSQHLPARLQKAVIFEDGSLVLSGPVMTADSIGLPLHLVSADGEILKSFGPATDVDPAGHIPGWIRRELQNANDGGFWAWHRSRYSIEKYTSTGERVLTLERDVEWFPGRDPGPSTSLAEGGPQPAVKGLVEDENGLLRFLLSLPAANWRQGVGERELEPGFEAVGAYRTPILDRTQVYDFAIEVIDPGTGEVLLSERFDASAFGWVDEDHFATYHTVDLDENDLDVPVIEIYRVEFRDGR